MSRKIMISEHNPVKEIVMNENRHGEYIYSVYIVFDDGSRLVIEGNDLSYYAEDDRGNDVTF